MHNLIRVNFIHCVYRHRLLTKDAQNSLFFKMVIVCVCVCVCYKSITFCCLQTPTETVFHRLVSWSLAPIFISSQDFSLKKKNLTICSPECSGYDCGSHDPHLLKSTMVSQLCRVNLCGMASPYPMWASPYPMWASPHSMWASPPSHVGITLSHVDLPLCWLYMRLHLTLPLASVC